MKQSVLGGLTVAVVLSAFGAPLPVHAQNADDNQILSSDAKLNVQGHLSENPLDLEGAPETPLEAPPSEVSSSSLTTEFVDPSQLASPSPTSPEAEAVSLVPTPSSEESSNAPASASHQDFSDFATVYAHALDTHQAATVYIRSIPVITVIGDELSTLGESKAADHSPAAIETDPVMQAQAIVDRLTELAAAGDPEAIQARWDSDQSAYLVSWNDQDLVAVNSRTILPDTTEDPAEDTLHIANRLRRLLGNAPALARVEGMPEPVAPPQNRVAVVTSTLTGTASWYGPGFHGRRSASGEVFNQNAMTAAHRTLPFGTQVRVTNLRNGQQVIVRINDRGPFTGGRIIDLSAAAASSIGLRASGVGQVQIEVLSEP